jgi:hypothetical protein
VQLFEARPGQSLGDWQSGGHIYTVRTDEPGKGRVIRLSQAPYPAVSATLAFAEDGLITRWTLAEHVNSDLANGLREGAQARLLHARTQW